MDPPHPSQSNSIVFKEICQLHLSFVLPLLAILLNFGTFVSIMPRGLPLINSTFNTGNCVSCIRAKQHKTPFTDSPNRATRRGELIHSDIVGPFTTSLGRSKYFLTFLDDDSHYCWVRPLHDKASAIVCKAFVTWIRELQNKGITVQILRTDRGGEYEGELSRVLKSLGVNHQRTASYSPQSNGRAERLNCILTETVRAMLFHANMPQTFSAEALQTATFTLNFLPSSTIQNKIPWEMWHGKPLSLDTLEKLHPFGSIRVVHAHVPCQRRWTKGKLAPRSTVGCFIGYQQSGMDEQTTTYKYWDFERKCFDYSNNLLRTVKFLKPNSFDTPPAAPSPPVFPSPYLTTNSDTTVDTLSDRPVYDMIVVGPLPHLQVFTTYSELPDANPITLLDALRRPDAEKWVKEMKNEMQSLKQKNSWKLCDLPSGRKVIGTKWVFKVKPDGRYQARLVAKGYAQIAGIDFDKMFAPVVRIEFVRCLLSYADFRRLRGRHIDATTAFLNGKSHLQLYIQQPEGFISPQFRQKALLLNKSLYGLKQAPRIWYLFSAV